MVSEEAYTSIRMVQDWREKRERGLRVKGGCFRKSSREKITPGADAEERHARQRGRVWAKHLP